MQPALISGNYLFWILKPQQPSAAGRLIEAASTFSHVRLPLVGPPLQTTSFTRELWLFLKTASLLHERICLFRRLARQVNELFSAQRHVFRNVSTREVETKGTQNFQPHWAFFSTRFHWRKSAAIDATLLLPPTAAWVTRKHSDY